MDISLANFITMFLLILKIGILLAASILAGISYFHSKEAKKMEGKLQVAMPGSVQLAMSIQLIFSVAFLFGATLLLLVF